jgi:hypothetical protein
MISFKYALAVAVLGVLTGSCNKDPAPPVPVTPGSGSVAIRLAFEWDGKPIVPGVTAHALPGISQVTVSRLNLLLSDIKFETENGEMMNADTVLYADASGDPLFMLNDIPAGVYQVVNLTIGLPAARNISGSLPATEDYLLMAWPEAMGGGYHFLKLEGHYTDSLAQSHGYAMHIGTPATASVHNKIPINMHISGGRQSEFTLVMNVAEWFRNPTAYDLLHEDNYTMGDAVLMQKLSDNGKDVFTVR